MNSLVSVMMPELVLVTVACILFLLGVSNRPAVRRLAPLLALAALVVVVVMEWTARHHGTGATEADVYGTFHLYTFGHYIKLLTAAVGILLVLLAWPTNADATGNSALNFGQEAGEFFALMLLSLAGVMLVGGANDIMLLFLGIELASIPTYIMVSISRPIPVAQEAGVKYFFLGAMSAAVMLFGFSYLYGTTGEVRLDKIAVALHTHAEAGNEAGHEAVKGLLAFGPWQTLAVVVLVAGFAFKMAAVPFHVYAGDVYQGAATPVTAFLSFVPKTSGFVALIKVLAAVGGFAGDGRALWNISPQIGKLLWVLAVLTMTFGNVLGLLQYNLKRLLAYSSISHSGYMLVGVTALVTAANGSGDGNPQAVQAAALQGVLFYLTAYGITNAAAFGVLMMLPSRSGRPGASAETFEDLAGQGRKHIGLGLAMTVACFSLIGMPLTVGFFGKFMLIKPALAAGNNWLVIATVVNAAISAAYYLKIVATLFLRPESTDDAAAGSRAVPIVSRLAFGPVLAAIALSVAGTLGFGTVLPLTNKLANAAGNDQARLEGLPPITSNSLVPAVASR